MKKLILTCKEEKKFWKKEQKKWTPIHACNTIFCNNMAEYQVYNLENNTHGEFCIKCSNEYRILDNTDITELTK